MGTAKASTERRALAALTTLGLTFLVSAGLLFSPASLALAEGPVNTNGTKYAIAGYDPIAYFEQKRAMRGSTQFHVSYRGATWLFASAANQAAFTTHPERFAPAYGGHCAYAAAQKRLVKIDPEAWSIVNGRLFLNYSLAVREKWNADQARFIHDADAYFGSL
jgi:YHS domain-containing protein